MKKQRKNFVITGGLFLLFILWTMAICYVDVPVSYTHLDVYKRQGLTLGRLASEVATVLRGKHKPTFTPHVDTGDYVIIVNAEKVVMTGKKLDSVKYYHHSGWLGGCLLYTSRCV